VQGGVFGEVEEAIAAALEAGGKAGRAKGAKATV